MTLSIASIHAQCRSSHTILPSRICLLVCSLFDNKQQRVKYTFRHINIELNKTSLSSQGLKS